MLAEKSLRRLQDRSLVGSCLEERQDRFDVDKNLEEEEDNSVESLPAAVDMLQHNVNNTTLYLANTAHITIDWTHFYLIVLMLNLYLQDAQLSQRDRAAACVIVFAKSRNQQLGDNILRTL